MEKGYVIGIDLGGTKINGAFADLQGNVLAMATTKTDAPAGEEVVLSNIISIIKEVISISGKSLGEVKAIGIGSPGPLNPEEGTIVNSPNLPFLNFNLVDPIRERFQVPVILDNDANVGALGEFLFGAGKGTKNMIYITVSTGIGGGAILNKKLYRGNTFNALEIGHMTVTPDKIRCNCGNYGCLEVMASGTAIGRQAKEAVDDGRTTTLSKYENPTSYEVFLEAENKDKVSMEILDRSLTYLGIGVANVITCFDPELVVIGGGVSKGGNMIIDKVKEVVRERCFKTLADGCDIKLAKLGTDAGVIGALALAVLEG
ncbi:MAG TPA: ROK family protein [Clostridiaceae bacterium]